MDLPVGGRRDTRGGIALNHASHRPSLTQFERKHSTVHELQHRVSMHQAVLSHPGFTEAQRAHLLEDMELGEVYYEDKEIERLQHLILGDDLGETNEGAGKEEKGRSLHSLKFPSIPQKCQKQVRIAVQQEPISSCRGSKRGSKRSNCHPETEEKGDDNEKDSINSVGDDEQDDEDDEGEVWGCKDKHSIADYSAVTVTDKVRVIAVNKQEALLYFQVYLIFLQYVY